MNTVPTRINKRVFIDINFYTFTQRVPENFRGGRSSPAKIWLRCILGILELQRRSCVDGILQQRELISKPSEFSRHMRARRCLQITYGLIEGIDFRQANAGTAIGSAHNGRICPCGQVEHECRFHAIWRRESILLDIDSVNIILPVVVARDGSASRVVDRQRGIA